MSSVTGLARFSELMLRCLFIWELFSPVNRDEIQETKPRWWNILTIIIRDYRSFVDSSNFTIKGIQFANFWSENTYKMKLCHFGCYLAKVKLKKKTKNILLGHPGWSIHMVKCSSRLPWRNRDLGDRASPVERSFMKRSLVSNSRHITTTEECKQQLFVLTRAYDPGFEYFSGLGGPIWNR